MFFFVVFFFFCFAFNHCLDSCFFFSKVLRWSSIAKTWISILNNSYEIKHLKHSFVQAMIVPILFYGCTTWTLTNTRMLQAILNNSWRQHPTKHQLYGHLPPITKTIPVRWTRHAGHCSRSRNELIRDVFQWTLSHGRAKAGRPARTYIQQLCGYTGCSPGDLPEAMKIGRGGEGRSGISVLIARQDDDDDDDFAET